MEDDRSPVHRLRDRVPVGEVAAVDLHLRRDIGSELVEMPVMARRGVANERAHPRSCANEAFDEMAADKAPGARHEHGD